MNKEDEETDICSDEDDGTTTPIKQIGKNYKTSHINTEEDAEEDAKDIIIKGLRKYKLESEDVIKGLNERILELEQVPKHGNKVKLCDLVKKSTKCDVLDSSSELLDEISALAILAQNNQINDKEFDGKRINECGNAMEDIFTNIDTESIISFTKSAGYPDREFKDKAYIEMKLVGHNQFDTTFRSFYVSTLNKIEKSLPHVLVTFIHIDGKLGSHKPIVKDIKNIELTLKCEFNTCNKYLYHVKPLIEFTEEDVLKKSYKELQKICKSFGIKANSSIKILQSELIKLLDD